ncbi:penicillin-binding transpeptidase domain-containing protein [Streptosporangium soli]|nr:hypothetical protein [Streptosporangium sp. KLBMP 9127]
MRRLLVLLAAVLVMGGAASLGVVAWFGQVDGTADDTARSYLAAWEAGDLEGMRALVDDPPSDFADRHRRFDEDLRVDSLTLKRGTIVRGDDSAELPLEGTRQIQDLGAWPFATTLRLAVRDRAWKVVWSPETLHPALRDDGELKLSQVKVPTAELVTRTGSQLPNDSAAEPYLAELNRRLGRSTTGWTIESVRGGVSKQLVVYQPEPARKVRTTLSRAVQAAAARALDGVRQPATLVAVRTGTGEVLAVADRLGDGRRAFDETYSPGGAFMMVTAAALLSAGLTPESQVSCPAGYTPPGGRSVDNAGRAAHGTVSLAEALALSCNTTFAQQAVERLTAGRLAEQAGALGFGRRLGSGVGGTCGRTPSPKQEDGRLAPEAIGQGKVTATPLCMALVAAAVENGTWRSPRLVTKKAAAALDKITSSQAEVPADVLGGLRDMMRAEAAQGRLPKGSAGHSGVTRPGSDGRADAWFVGYRENVAFAVFVKDGRTARATATPIASRFLRAL